MKNNFKIGVGGLVAACAFLLCTNVQATTITLNTDLTDPYSVGDCVPGVGGLSGGQAVDYANIVNLLAPMALNSSGSFTVSGATPVDTFTCDRSGNFFSPLPTVSISGSTVTSGYMLDGSLNIITGNYVSLTLGSGYNYLVAKYDGKNGGAEVWDVSGIAAGTTILLPYYAFGSSPTQYAMTGWATFNTTKAPNNVPDGGITAILLGVALAGIGIIRKFQRA